MHLRLKFTQARMEDSDLFFQILNVLAKLLVSRATDGGLVNTG